MTALYLNIRIWRLRVLMSENQDTGWRRRNVRKTRHPCPFPRGSDTGWRPLARTPRSSGGRRHMSIAITTMQVITTATTSVATIRIIRTPKKMRMRKMMMKTKAN